MRRKKLLLNTGSALINQLITLISGFIIPRLIIEYYGSGTNGLVSSISQFLAFFAMTEMGVGAVVRAALYKPVADTDQLAISKVLVSSKRFFNKIGLLLCLYTLILMVYFPLSVDHRIGYISTAILVFAIAFHSIANYLLGIIYRQLLNADQKAYIQFGVCILTTILNTVVSIVLIKKNASIVIVKLAAALVFLLNPLLMKIYVDRHYDLNLKVTLTEEPLKQKWNALAQHVANYVLKHTDTLILTWFSTLENVSIYYVYHLVANGLQQLIEILLTGVSSLLGNMYAKNEKTVLDRTFSSFELFVHIAVSFIYSVAAVLIIPFVKVYTKGVTDANYIVPVFALLIVIANGAYCLRMPYEIMVLVAGHFKETQLSSIIEALINIVLSIILVHGFGLVGVAIGTLVAMLYRTIYLAWYLQTHIIFRPFIIYFKHMIIDVISVICIWFSTKWFTMQAENWLSWVILALKVSFIAFIEVIIINSFFYRGIIGDSFKLIFNKITRKEQ